MVSQTQAITGVSLGMVIIDDIHIPNKPPLTDVIGGSGSFVTLGQRLFAMDPATVGCLVIAGQDFPEAVEDAFRSLGITLTINRVGALTTRGLLEYEDDTFGPKTFRYTGGPLKASPVALVDTSLLHAKAFHFFGTPEEILDQVPQLLSLREEGGTVGRPLVVWEPFPAACKPQHRQLFFDACKVVDVFSPNHLEMAALFDDSPIYELEPAKLESFGNEFIESSIGPTGTGILVVRAGEHGSLTMSRTSRATWLPSFYDKGSPKVVDPTGAGNSFLGGYMAGWLATHDINEAVSYGHVAASFAIEQIGLPKHSKEGGNELWNGVNVLDRLQDHRARLKDGKVKSESFV